MNVSTNFQSVVSKHCNSDGTYSADSFKTLYKDIYFDESTSCANYIKNLESAAMSTFSSIPWLTPKANELGLTLSSWSNIITVMKSCKTDIMNAIDNAYSFEYTGSTQQLTIEETGTYIIRCAGAQGGNMTLSQGGLGGYVMGTIDLSAGDILYITVGGQNGYNGGGDATGTYGANGGGATEVYLNSTDTENLLLIAGGGGGALQYDTNNYKDGKNSTAGINNSTFKYGDSGAAGGGGGYYGGTCGNVTTVSIVGGISSDGQLSVSLSAAAGGMSYISSNVTAGTTTKLYGNVGNGYVDICKQDETE